MNFDELSFEDLRRLVCRVQPCQVARLLESAHVPTTSCFRVFGIHQVCECGHDATSAVPVVDGYVLNRAVQRGIRGGEWLTQQCYAYLAVSVQLPID